MNIFLMEFFSSNLYEEFFIDISYLNFMLPIEPNMNNSISIPITLLARDIYSIYICMNIFIYVYAYIHR